MRRCIVCYKELPTFRHSNLLPSICSAECWDWLRRRVIEPRQKKMAASIASSPKHGGISITKDELLKKLEPFPGDVKIQIMQPDSLNCYVASAGAHILVISDGKGTNTPLAVITLSSKESNQQ